MITGMYGFLSFAFYANKSALLTTTVTESSEKAKAMKNTNPKYNWYCKIENTIHTFKMFVAYSHTLQYGSY